MHDKISNKISNKHHQIIEYTSQDFEQTLKILHIRHKIIEYASQDIACT